MYVIRRMDKGGEYVAREGSTHNYTRDIEHAWQWGSRAEAERYRGQRETIVALDPADHGLKG